MMGSCALNAAASLELRPCRDVLKSAVIKLTEFESRDFVHNKSNKEKKFVIYWMGYKFTGF